jgi:hypothetical protein
VKKFIETINSGVNVIKNFAPFIAAVSAGLAAFSNTWDEHSKGLKNE